MTVRSKWWIAPIVPLHPLMFRFQEEPSRETDFEKNRVNHIEEAQQKRGWAPLRHSARLRTKLYGHDPELYKGKREQNSLSTTKNNVVWGITKFNIQCSSSLSDLPNARIQNFNELGQITEYICNHTFILIIYDSLPILHHSQFSGYPATRRTSQACFKWLGNGFTQKIQNSEQNTETNRWVDTLLSWITVNELMLLTTNQHSMAGFDQISAHQAQIQGFRFELAGWELMLLQIWPHP